MLLQLWTPVGVITAGVIVQPVDGLGQHAIEAKVDSTKVSNTDFNEECIEEQIDMVKQT